MVGQRTRSASSAWRRAGAVVLLGLGFGVSSGLARAEVTTEDRAAARALFDQARALAEKGQHAEACPKFEESQRLDPGVGTLFNLADCYEKMGKTASAWSTFLEVAAQTRAAGQPEREKAARERASALEPALSRLTVVVPEAARVPGLEVKRDATLVRPPMWGAPMPVDPGKHAVHASAPGHKPWTASIEVPGKGASLSVQVLALEPLDAGAPGPVAPGPSAAPAAAPTQPSTSPDAAPAGDAGRGQRLAGFVVGGAGLVGLGVGTVLAFGARSRFQESEAHCREDLCSQAGVDIRDDARGKGTVATVVGGIGVAALAAGAVLVLTAPSAGASRASRATPPTVAVGPGSLLLRGTW